MLVSSKPSTFFLGCRSLKSGCADVFRIRRLYQIGGLSLALALVASPLTARADPETAAGKVIVDGLEEAGVTMPAGALHSDLVRIFIHVPIVGGAVTALCSVVPVCVKQQEAKIPAQTRFPVNGLSDPVFLKRVNGVENLERAEAELKFLPSIKIPPRVNYLDVARISQREEERKLMGSGPLSPSLSHAWPSG